MTGASVTNKGKYEENVYLGLLMLAVQASITNMGKSLPSTALRNFIFSLNRTRNTGYVNSGSYAMNLAQRSLHRSSKLFVRLNVS